LNDVQHGFEGARSDVWRQQINARELHCFKRHRARSKLAQASACDPKKYGFA
jgi:hypothetical protein